MKMIKLKILFLALLTLTLASCGSKTGSSSVKLKVGNIIGTGSSSTLNGGVLIMGRSLDSQERIRIGIPNGYSDISLDLKKAKWEFAAVAWEGASGPMTGVVRCGFSGVVDINSDNAAVNFNMTRGACKGGASSAELIEFSDPTFLESDMAGDITQFKRIMLRSCLNHANPGSLNGSSCATSDGLSNSFKIQILGEQKKPSGITLLPGMMSNCYPREALTDLRLPVGTGGNSFIKYTLMAYTSTDCSGGPIAYPFADKSPYQGLNSASLKSNLTNYSYSSDYVSLIAIEHNPATFNEISIFDNLRFGLGSDGDKDITIPVEYVSAADYAKLLYIDAGDSSKIKIKGAALQFRKFDEIMWYVNYEKGTGKCGASGSDTDRFNTGMFGYAMILDRNTSGGNTDLVLSKRITAYNLNDGTLVNLEVPTSARLLGDCSMQVVRVRHYNNLTFTYSGGYFKPQPYFFDGADETGGILVARVKGEMKMNTSSFSVTAADKGINYVSALYQPDCVALLKKCMFIGQGSVAAGGGIIAIQSASTKNIGGNSILYINAHTSNPSSKGGFVDVYTPKINDGGFDFTIHVGSRDYGSVTNQPYFLKHCTKTGNVVLIDDKNTNSPIGIPFENVCF